ncbi:MAG: type II toxin-antitoxin system VapC family toxin [Thermoproteota archaeon]|jgi:predicted nucleic acid-binding protein|nr:type II toxin-antitoxin system VapC family toxin [Thermoproteota archaeon]
MDKDFEEREIKYLIDASSIAILLGKIKEKAVEFLEEASTLDLAIYELGNFIWKECTLKKMINRDEAIDKIKDLTEIIALMDVKKLEKEDVIGVMQIALDLKLTFYDASYLHVAKSTDKILITNDSELLDKAKKIGVKAAKLEEFLKTNNISPVTR